MLLVVSLFFLILLRPSPVERPGGPSAVRLAIPPPKEQARLSPRPRLALIIDDGGYNLESFRELLGVGRPMTFAILPHATHARRAAELARQQGGEIMLHLPMEPEGGNPLEKNSVLAGMEPAQVQRILEEGLQRVPQARGVNNHMGSKAISDRRVMESIMEVLEREGLYFIDSRTSPRSAAPAAARRAGVPFARSDRFIDHEKSLPAIIGALRQVMGKARREGKAVAIGHPHPLTLQALREILPEIERQGVRLVRASEVVG